LRHLPDTRLLLPRRSPLRSALFARARRAAPTSGVAGDGPPGGIVKIRVRAPQIVIVLEDFSDGFRHAIEVSHLIEKPVQRPFGARAIVAHDGEDERVIELAEIIDGLNEAAGLKVGVLA